MQFSVDKGFMSRGIEYQKKLWESYVARDRGRLFLAIYQGEVIGGLICILFGKKCLAMHMGTPYKYHKLHTSYAYVWESIRWAKEKGCVWYSFRGVGTTPTQEAFKAKFNPKVVHLVGYYDYPFKPFLYKIFYFAEFTLLPASWPLIVRTRRLANRLKIVKTQ
jgi:lipid II:glycine glycyltransferase (peptidoglycan interpeptide bridge formation enzyme)